MSSRNNNNNDNRLTTQGSGLRRILWKWMEWRGVHSFGLGRGQMDGSWELDKDIRYGMI